MSIKAAKAGSAIALLGLATTFSSHVVDGAWGHHWIVVVVFTFLAIGSTILAYRILEIPDVPKTVDDFLLATLAISSMMMVPLFTARAILSVALQYASLLIAIQTQTLVISIVKIGGTTGIIFVGLGLTITFTSLSLQLIAAIHDHFTEKAEALIS